MIFVKYSRAEMSGYFFAGLIARIEFAGLNLEVRLK